MPRYSVAQAKNGLPKLIDKAMQGEEVVITRRGKVVAELNRKTETLPASTRQATARLRKRVAGQPTLPIPAKSFRDWLYDDPSN